MTLSDTTDVVPSSAHVDAVRVVVRDLLAAFKKSTLYPSDHEMRRQSVEQVARRVDAFVSGTAPLRLVVEDDRLLWEGHDVGPGSESVRTLAQLFFRDGVLWFEFLEGLQAGEVDAFIGIVSRYRVVSEDSEGDIVTALWEAGLPHLRYQASDACWEGEQLCEIGEKAVPRKRDGQLALPEPASPPAGSTIDPASFILTAADMKTLGREIEREEKRDVTRDAFELMLFVIMGACEVDVFEAVMEYFAEEIPGALEQGRFSLCHRTLRRLSAVRDSCRSRRPWAVERMDACLVRICENLSHDRRGEFWEGLGQRDEHDLAEFSKILELLPPEGALTLVDVASRLDDEAMENRLMESALFLAQGRLGELAGAAMSGGEDIALGLLHLSGGLHGDAGANLLLRQLADHSSLKVRARAMVLLSASDNLEPGKFLRHVTDRDERKRREFISHLAGGKSAQMEGILIEHLEFHEFRKTQCDLILDCYRALGHCGTAGAIPFLKGSLLDRGWMPGPVRSAHREGALVAMILIGGHMAEEIVEKAPGSPYPPVRNAYKRVVAGEKWKDG